MGTDMYTLLIQCTRQITNEDHCYSTRNLNGKKSKEEDVYVCVCVVDSLNYTVETDTAV